MSDRIRCWPVFAIPVLLAACAVGPDYVRPPAPPGDGFTQADPRVIRSGPDLPEQPVRPEAPIPARWWEAFGSSELDVVVDRALRNSPTVDGARATLAQARHELDAAQGVQAPQLTLSVAAQRGQ